MNKLKVKDITLDITLAHPLTNSSIVTIRSSNIPYISSILSKIDKEGYFYDDNIISSVDEKHTLCSECVEKSPIDLNKTLKNENDKLREFIDLWSDISQLQTYNNRELFRKQAKALLRPLSC